MTSFAQLGFTMDGPLDINGVLDVRDTPGIIEKLHQECVDSSFGHSKYRKTLLGGSSNSDGHSDPEA